MTAFTLFAGICIGSAAFSIVLDARRVSLNQTLPQIRRTITAPTMLVRVFNIITLVSGAIAAVAAFA